MLLRAQRATVANAVLVVRRPDGCILALALPSGELRLPDKQLDAWVPIDTQVEEWLEQLLESSCAPSLVAVDGTPGRKGVTFLYVAHAGASASDQGKGTWLDPQIALGTVPADDRRLLILSKC